MQTIGTLSRATGVKVPTIRYYEGIGLMPAPERSAGGQRHYGRVAQDRLAFIKHARDLGFPLDTIRALIALDARPDHSCAEAGALARAQLDDVRARIARLQRLEIELARMAAGCDGSEDRCTVLASLSDHGTCVTEH